MRIAQKIIKALALALAGFIMIMMVVALVSGVSFMAALTGGEDWKWGNNTGSWVGEEYQEQEIREIDMSVKATNVKFRKATDGESVRVETNNEHVTTWIDNKKLTVIEKSHGIFGWGGTGDVIVYLRDGVKLDNVRISIGAGTLTIDELNTKSLDLELGAGKTEISNLKVTENARIDGGAGVLDLRSGELRNANIELGAGKADIKAKISGHSKVDSGVGKLDLDLIGKEKDYKITIDKGIGSVTLNGQKMSDNEIWGSGDNRVEVDSGVGAVEIRIVEE